MRGRLRDLRLLDGAERDLVLERSRLLELPVLQRLLRPSGALLTPRRRVRGFLWGAGSGGVLALVVFLALRAAQPHAQGGSPSGGTPPPGPRATAADAETRIRAAIARNPDDDEARLDLARLLLGKRDLEAVRQETQHVLARSPGHPRALAYQALVRLATGEADVAESMLKQALAAAPDLLEAYLHLAYVYVKTGRTRQAEATIAEASRRFPSEAQRLEVALAQLKETVSRGEAASLASPTPGQPTDSSSVPPAR